MTIQPVEKLSKDFDNDNLIYIKGKVFRYNLSYIEGNYFKNFNKVKFIEIFVQGGVEPFVKSFPNYNQTVIKYSFYDANNKYIGSERTGVIENETNLWLHPPRYDDLLILNTNSYPFLTFEKKWLYELNVTFNEVNTNVISVYKVINEKDYLLIKTRTKSDLGDCSATFKYSPIHGFLEMNYTNFDNSQVILTLIDDVNK
jgi:hypothetical protein